MLYKYYLTSSSPPPYEADFFLLLHYSQNFPGGSVVKNPPAKAGDKKDGSLISGRKDPLEKEMATYSSILAWKIPWMEEPDRLQSMGLQSQTWLSDFTFTFLDKQNRIFRVLLSLYHASAVYLQYQKADLSPFHLCWSKYNFKHPESSLAILASLCSFFHWLLL